MRNKFFDKLKDYKDECYKNSDDAKPPVVSKDKELKSMSSRPQIKSGRANDTPLKDLNITQSKSFNSKVPIFTRRVSVRKSNCFEIYPRSYTPGIV